jgi:hypothetical protein
MQTPSSAGLASELFEEMAEDHKRSKYHDENYLLMTETYYKDLPSAKSPAMLPIIFSQQSSSTDDDDAMLGLTVQKENINNLGYHHLQRECVYYIHSIMFSPANSNLFYLFV